MDGQTDGRMDEWPDRQTEESDFIGHCPTNIERLKVYLKYRRNSKRHYCNLKFSLFRNAQLSESEF